MTYSDLKALDEKATQGEWRIQQEDNELTIALVNWFRSTEGQQVFKDAERYRAQRTISYTTTPSLARSPCPHCGKNVWDRCIPPRDYTKCSFYRAMLAAAPKEGK